MSKPRIAFLGLGILGDGMARRVPSHGFPLTVFNRNSEESRVFAMNGATVANSPREAAKNAEVIIGMVADDNASRALWFDETGALAGANPGMVCIECSTGTVGRIHERATTAQEHKCGFLDAPETGSKARAASGELNFIVVGHGGIERIPKRHRQGTWRKGHCRRG